QREQEPAWFYHDQTVVGARWRQELEFRIPSSRLSRHGHRQCRNEGEGTGRAHRKPGFQKWLTRLAAIRTGHDSEAEPAACLLTRACPGVGRAYPGFRAGVPDADRSAGGV